MLGLLTLNAMVVATEVLIPIQCEYYALEGLTQLIKTIEMVKKHLNPAIHVSSIVLTMYDQRTNLAREVAHEVRTPLPRRDLRPDGSPFGPRLRGSQLWQDRHHA